jgi:phosphoglycerol transferase
MEPCGAERVGPWLRSNALLLAIPALFVALVVRDTGLYPSVFADEWAYSTTSRLLPLARSWVPDYGYFAVYGLTNNCGDGFLTCARILNAAAFVTAAPFIYLTARRVCARNVASLVTLVALAGPINTYTAYFMPEALYFLSFWIFAWYFLRLDTASSPTSWVSAGALLGAATLVKPHALFLVPAIVAYLVYLGKGRRQAGMSWSVTSAGAVTVAALIVKLIGGYLLAGDAGLTLFGPAYAAVASSALAQPDQVGELLARSTKSLIGHGLAVCLMFGLPVALSTVGSIRGLRSSRLPEDVYRFSVFTLGILLALIVTAALFTATVTGPYESTARIHMRYYDFSFPLLLIVVGAAMSSVNTAGRSRLQVVVAVPIAIAIIYAIAGGMGSYSSNLVDGPELRGFIRYPMMSVALGGLSVGIVVLWALGTVWGPRLFMYGFLPVAVVVTSVTGSVELRRHLVPSEVDRAGMFVKWYLPREELSHVLVVGSETADLYRALFYLDDAQASSLVIGEGTSYDLATMPQGKDWALILGDHGWHGGESRGPPTAGFRLVQRAGASGDRFGIPVTGQHRSAILLLPRRSKAKGG